MATVAVNSERVIWHDFFARGRPEIPGGGLALNFFESGVVLRAIKLADVAALD